jgi:CMP/dCMP kinase
MAKPEKPRAPSDNTVICISGMAGTGKSTLSRKLAEKYGLRYYCGGDALKDLAKQEGYTITKEGWWESPEGLKFLQERVNDPKFDKVVDDKLLENAKKGNVLLDSWTMPWLLQGGFKIWLAASLEKRAARVAERDKITLKEAYKMLEEKEANTKAIYKALYGFSLDDDFTPFDLILDTDNLTAPEVFDVLCRVIDNIVFSAPTA